MVGNVNCIHTFSWFLFGKVFFYAWFQIFSFIFMGCTFWNKIISFFFCETFSWKDVWKRKYLKPLFLWYAIKLLVLNKIWYIICRHFLLHLFNILLVRFHLCQFEHAIFTLHTLTFYVDVHHEYQACGDECA